MQSVGSQIDGLNGGLLHNSTRWEADRRAYYRPMQNLANNLSPFRHIFHLQILDYVILGPEAHVKRGRPIVR